MSAAALSVGVGSFSDPDNLPGLAHFLEHLAFMGSLKYPKENAFDQFLKAHGGSTNAHTDLEMTTYSFDIRSNHFKKGLEMFSQCILAPSLTPDSMGKEIKSVQSEWAMTTQDDDSRFEQLLGSLAKQGHPMRKFSWGNTDSLKIIPEGKDDVHQALLDFQKKFYCPQFMTLTVIAKATLAHLEDLVKKFFASVPRSEELHPDFSRFGAPFDTTEFRSLCRIVPVKHVQWLQVTWALPSQRQQYRKQPIQFIEYMLSHEGEGSLTSLLRQREWIVSVNQSDDDSLDEQENSEEGSDHYDNSTWSAVKLRFSMTGAGLSKICEVITTIYQYINLIKNNFPLQRLWQELHVIEQNEFYWLDSEENQEYVRKLSANMQHCSSCDIVTGSSFMEYDDQVIRSCLGHLTPNQMNASVWSKSFQNETAEHHTEDWYKTAYYVEEISAEWIQTWTSCGTSEGLFPPTENPFVATDFTIKAHDCTIENLESPLLSSTTSQLWFKQDKDFNVPKAYMRFILKSSEANKPDISICLTDMYVLVLRYLMKEACYPAEVARLKYAIHVTESGITIQLSGFSHKLKELFTKVVDKIAAFKQISDELFTTLHQELANLYDNDSLSPQKLNKELNKCLLQIKCRSILQKKESLASVDKAQFHDFVSNFFTGMFVRVLIQGNMTAAEALDMDKYLINQLCITSARNPGPLHQTQLTQLPPVFSVFAVNNLNADDENAVIVNYYQFGLANLQNRLVSELLLTKMEGPCFSKLRTSLQLGYTVESRLRNEYDVLGFSIELCSQASNVRIENVDDYIDNFVESYKDSILQLNQSNFEELISSFMEDKESDNGSLNEEVEKNWREVLQGTFRFNHQSEEVDELKKVTLDDVKALAQVLFEVKNPLRKLSIQVIGNNGSLRSEPKKLKIRHSVIQYQNITDIEKFKSLCQPYTRP